MCEKCATKIESLEKAVKNLAAFKAMVQQLARFPCVSLHGLKVQHSNLRVSSIHYHTEGKGTIRYPERRRSCGPNHLCKIL